MKTCFQYVVGLILLTFIAMGCTRSIDDEPNASLNLTAPSSIAAPKTKAVQSLSISQLIAFHIVVNVKEAGTNKLLHVGHWDNRCAEEEHHGPPPAGSTHNTTGDDDDMLMPDCLAQEVRVFAGEFSPGKKVFVQVLGVYGDPENESIKVFGYNDKTITLSAGVNTPTIAVELFGADSNSRFGKIAGQYVTSVSGGKGHGPTGRVAVSLKPPQRPDQPMLIQLEEMYDGWFSMMGITGVPFEYTLIKTKEKLDFAAGLGSSENPNCPDCQFDKFLNRFSTGPIVNWIMGVELPDGVYVEEDCGGSPCGDRRQIEGGSLVMGFFGPARNQLTAPKACYPTGTTLSDLYDAETGGNNIDFYTSQPADPNKISMLGDGTTSGGVAIGSCTSANQFINEINFDSDDFDDGLHDVAPFYGPFANDNITYTGSCGSDNDIFGACYDDTANTMELQWNYIPGVFNGPDAIDGVILYAGTIFCPGDRGCNDYFRHEDGYACDKMEEYGLPEIARYTSAGTTSHTMNGVNIGNDDQFLAFLCPYRGNVVFSAAADTYSYGDHNMGGGSGPPANVNIYTEWPGPNINTGACMPFNVELVDAQNNPTQSDSTYNVDISYTNGGSATADFFTDRNCSTPLGGDQVVFNNGDGGPKEFFVHFGGSPSAGIDIVADYNTGTFNDDYGFSAVNANQANALASSGIMVMMDTEVKARNCEKIMVFAVDSSGDPAEVPSGPDFDIYFSDNGSPSGAFYDNSGDCESETSSVTSALILNNNNETYQEVWYRNNTSQATFDICIGDAASCPPATSYFGPITLSNGVQNPPLPDHFHTYVDFRGLDNTPRTGMCYKAEFALWSNDGNGHYKSFVPGGETFQVVGNNIEIWSDSYPDCDYGLGNAAPANYTFSGTQSDKEFYFIITDTNWSIEVQGPGMEDDDFGWGPNPTADQTSLFFEDATLASTCNNPWDIALVDSTGAYLSAGSKSFTTYIDLQAIDTGASSPTGFGSSCSSESMFYQTGGFYNTNLLGAQSFNTGSGAGSVNIQSNAPGLMIWDGGSPVNPLPLSW